jgi:hypothetical protein
VVAGAAIGAFIAWALWRPKRAWKAMNRLIPWQGMLKRLVIIGRLDGDHTAKLVLIETARYFVYCAQLSFLVAALFPAAGFTLPFLGSMVVFFVKFLVPVVTVMDLGVREGAAVFVMSLLGVAPEAALGASLLLFAINMVLPSLAGAPLVAGMRWKQSDIDLRHPAAQPTDARS